MINLVYSRRLGSAPLKAVMVCLADKADDEGGNAYPSVPTISDETDLAQSSVHKALKEAKVSQLISELGSRNVGPGAFVKVYAFNLPVWLALPIVKSHKRHAEKYAWAEGANPPPSAGPPPPHREAPSATRTTPLRHADPIPLEPQINPIAAAAVELWNELADQNERRAIKRLSDKRQLALLSAIDEIGGIDAWKEAVAAIGASDWIKGAKPQGFDFDGLIAKPDKLIGLIEGKYKDHADAPKETYADYVLRNTRARSPEELEAEWQRLIARGELPKEDGGNLIDYCIRKYGISSAAPARDRRDGLDRVLDERLARHHNSEKMGP